MNALHSYQVRKPAYERFGINFIPSFQVFFSTYAHVTTCKCLLPVFTIILITLQPYREPGVCK